MDIRFTDKELEYISRLVAGSYYSNASEVVREAVRLHEVQRSNLIGGLRCEIEKGWSGAASSKSVQNILQDKARLSEKYKGAFTSEDAQSFDEHTRKSRAEWDE